MKVYVAGPMTGLPNKNFPAFDKARDKLLAKGYWVVSPADLERNRDTLSYEGQMKDDLKHLLECDAIFLLEGWEFSKGASVEHFVARVAGLIIMFDEDAHFKQVFLVCGRSYV